MCYVGTLPCGCILAAQVDDPARTKEVAESVAGFIKDGLTIERHPSAWVRQHFGRCKKHQESEEKDNLRLFD
jgi:hypothetical protein